MGSRRRDTGTIRSGLVNGPPNSEILSVLTDEIAKSMRSAYWREYAENMLSQLSTIKQPGHATWVRFSLDWLEAARDCAFLQLIACGIDPGGLLTGQCECSAKGRTCMSQSERDAGERRLRVNLKGAAHGRNRA
jgi:hypothetical protein